MNTTDFPTHLLRSFWLLGLNDIEGVQKTDLSLGYQKEVIQ